MIEGHAVGSQSVVIPCCNDGQTASSQQCPKCRLFVAYEFSVALTHFPLEDGEKSAPVVGLNVFSVDFGGSWKLLISGSPGILSLLRL